MAGKQRLQKLFLGENKLMSTAGLEDLPAITGVSIDKNMIREVPNPEGVLGVIGKCECARRANPPSGGGFSDGDNPVRVPGERSRMPSPYLRAYFATRLETMIPGLERRLRAGETIGMADFKRWLRIEDVYPSHYGNDWTGKAIVANEYALLFIRAEQHGFEVNRKEAEAAGNDDLLAMRAGAGARVEDFISVVKYTFL